MAKDNFALDMTADPAEFVEAVDEFSKRRVISREEADQLSDYARRRSWWISGVAQMDVANDAHRSILESMRDGTPFEEWKKKAGAAIEREWGRKDSGRLLLIYRNATTTAYNAGRLEQMEQPHVTAVRPYKMLDVVNDERTSHICRKFISPEVVLPWDDPWWLTHSPPFHHLCRTGIRSLRKSVAQRYGISAEPPVVDIAPGWGLHPKWAEPPKPSDRKVPPDIALHLEQARKGIEDTQRKAVEIPKKSLAKAGKLTPEQVKDQVAQLPEAPVLPKPTKATKAERKRQQKQLESTITQEQRDALALFTDIDFGPMRKAEAAGFKGEMADEARVLAGLVKGQAEVNAPLQLYRGMELTPNLTHKLLRNDTFDLKATSSFGADPSIALEFATGVRSLTAIGNPKRIPVLLKGNLKGMPVVGTELDEEELESLIPGQKLRIISRSMLTDPERGPVLVLDVEPIN